MRMASVVALESTEMVSPAAAPVREPPCLSAMKRELAKLRSDLLFLSEDAASTKLSKLKGLRDSIETSWRVCNSSVSAAYLVTGICIPFHATWCPFNHDFLTPAERQFYLFEVEINEEREVERHVELARINAEAKKADRKAAGKCKKKSARTKKVQPDVVTRDVELAELVEAHAPPAEAAKTPTDYNNIDVLPESSSNESIMADFRLG